VEVLWGEEIEKKDCCLYKDSVMGVPWRIMIKPDRINLNWIIPE